MGISCSDHGSCSKFSFAPREKLPAFHSSVDEEEEGPEDKIATARARIDQKEHEEEEALKKAALEAVQRNALNKAAHNRKGSNATFPEVSGLGDSVEIVVTGRQTDDMEMAFEAKAVASKGLNSIQELADVHLVAARSLCGNVPSFLRPNQDDYFYVQTNDSFRIFGVFDGHGIDGHHIAAIARDFMLRGVMQRIPAQRSSSNRKYVGALQAMFVELFQTAHLEIASRDEVDATLSGVAATIVVHDIRRGWVTCAWAGNCRCCLGDVQDVVIDLNEEFGDAAFVKKKNLKIKKKLLMVPLTKDHTLDRPDERARILATGAQLRPSKSGGPHEVFAPGEQWPGIPVTRCLGNLVAHQFGVIHVPEVFDRDLAAGRHDPAFLMVASDGIWGVMKEGDILTVLKDTFEENLVYGAEQLVEKSRKLWEQKEHKIVDDITLLVTKL